MIPLVYISNGIFELSKGLHALLLNIQILIVNWFLQRFNFRLSAIVIKFNVTTDFLAEHKNHYISFTDRNRSLLNNFVNVMVQCWEEVNSLYPMWSWCAIKRSYFCIMWSTTIFYIISLTSILNFSLSVTPVTKHSSVTLPPTIVDV